MLLLERKDAGCGLAGSKVTDDAGRPTWACRLDLYVGQPDVLKVEDDSVWLPLFSIASTSHE